MHMATPVNSVIENLVVKNAPIESFKYVKSNCKTHHTYEGTHLCANMPLGKGKADTIPTNPPTEFDTMDMMQWLSPDLWNRVGVPKWEDNMFRSMD